MPIWPVREAASDVHRAALADDVSQMRRCFDMQYRNSGIVFLAWCRVAITQHLASDDSNETGNRMP